jgi:hypothetical protein
MVSETPLRFGFAKGKGEYHKRHKKDTTGTNIRQGKSVFVLFVFPFVLLVELPRPLVQSPPFSRRGGRAVKIMPRSFDRR